MVEADGERPESPTAKAQLSTSGPVTRSGAFPGHALRRRGRVDDPVLGPKRGAASSGGGGGADRGDDQQRADTGEDDARAAPGRAQACAGRIHEQRDAAGERQRDMNRQEPAERTRGADDHDGDAGKGPRGAQHPGEAQRQTGRSPRAHQAAAEHNGQPQAEHHVQHDVDEVEERRARERGEVRGIEREEDYGDENHGVYQLPVLLSLGQLGRGSGIGGRGSVSERLAAAALFSLSGVRPKP